MAETGAGSEGAGSPPAAQVEEELTRLLGGVAVVRREIGGWIVGQEEAVEELLVTLLAGGHALLEGVPGLGKTLLIRTLAGALDLDFRRIQFTPDLMPGDITGTEVLEEDRATGRREVRFLRGPVFTQVLLADEINRAPPKTQAALLEAMQEGSVSAGGETLRLPVPFLVLATQNPIEQEGTYPLPEAQLDRFLLKVRLDYPSSTEEVEILRSTTGAGRAAVTPSLDAAGILRLRELVREVPISEVLLEYAARLVRCTRPGSDETAPDAGRWLRWGAGPRAGQAMILGAKSLALLRGRLHVTPDDLRRVAPAVLRHRVLLNFRAEAEGIPVDRVIQDILDSVPPPAGRAG